MRMFVHFACAVALTVAATLVPASGSAQIEPLGAEFVANTYLTSRQGAPAVAGLATGEFVAVWDSGSFGSPRDGNDSAVVGQRYSSDGTPLAGEFIVNTYTTGFQERAAVAASDSGFAVVWQSSDFGTPDQDGDGRGIFGQAFDNSASPVGDEFAANVITTGEQFAPVVAAGASDFFVAWHDGSGDSVFDRPKARRVSASGVALATEFAVDTGLLEFYGGLDAAGLSSGGFIVVWAGANEDEDDEIAGRLFDAAGVGVGGDFVVNEHSAGYQYAPKVAANLVGGFHVVWSDYTSEEVEMRTFDSAGTPLTGDFVVNSFSAGVQYSPDVAVAPSGDVIVTWQSIGFDGPPRIIPTTAFMSARNVNSAGMPVGTAFEVGTLSGESFFYGSGIAGGGGDPALPRFMVVWANGAESEDENIFARMLGPEAGEPVCGNEIIEDGEDCDDGNVMDGDCCSSECTAEMGDPCDLDGDLCTVDVCDQAGQCSYLEDVQCADSGDICLAATTCNPSSGACEFNCRDARSAVFTTRVFTRPNGRRLDKVRWRWFGGEPTLHEEFGDPSDSTVYGLCAYDFLRGQPMLIDKFEIEAGGPWNEGPQTWTYKDKPGSDSGTTVVRLRTKASGHGILRFDAGYCAPGCVDAGAQLDPPVLFDEDQFAAFDPFFTVRMSNSDGQCWESVFDRSLKNNGKKLSTRFRNRVVGK